MDLTIRELQEAYLKVQQDEEHTNLLYALVFNQGWQREVNSKTGKRRYKTIHGARIGLCQLLYSACHDPDITLSIFKKSDLYPQKAPRYYDARIIAYVANTNKGKNALKPLPRPMKIVFPLNNNTTPDIYIYNTKLVDSYYRLYKTDNIHPSYANFLIILLDMVSFKTPDKDRYFTVYEQELATRLGVSTRQVKTYVARANMLHHIIKHPNPPPYPSGHSRLMVAIPASLYYGQLPAMPAHKRAGRPRKQSSI